MRGFGTSWQESPIKEAGRPWPRMGPLANWHCIRFDQRKPKRYLKVSVMLEKSVFLEGICLFWWFQEETNKKTPILGGPPKKTQPNRDFHVPFLGSPHGDT